jgi:hypothetical protein
LQDEGVLQGDHVEFEQDVLMRTNNMPVNILVLLGIATSIILQLLFTLLFYQMQRILTHSSYILQESARMHLILDLFDVVANIDEGGFLINDIVPKLGISKVGQKLSIFMWLMILIEIFGIQSHHLILQYSILIDLRHKAKMVEHLNSPSNTSILRKGNKKLLKVAEHYIFPRIE